MKKISFWANSHMYQAQLILFLVTLLVCTVGIGLGSFLSAFSFKFPLIVLIGLSVAIPMLVVKFPRHGSYWLKRKFHLALYACSFIGCLMLGNWFTIEIASLSSTQDNSIASHSLIYKVSQKPRGAQQYKHPLNVLKKGLFEFGGVKKVATKVQKKIKRMEDRFRRLPRGWAFLIFFLASFGAFILTLAMAALACGAGCSGSPAGATIFGIWTIICLLGTLFLLGYAFYRLFERTYYTPPPPPTPAPNTEKPKG